MAKDSKQRKKSDKGALVKGSSKPLPVELLSEPSFRDGLQAITRGYSGLYLLYKRRRLYYIGLANNLYWRLVSHTRNRHKGSGIGLQFSGSDGSATLRTLSPSCSASPTRPGTQ